MAYKLIDFGLFFLCVIYCNYDNMFVMLHETSVKIIIILQKTFHTKVWKLN
jgi:hypothetical protein